MFNTPYIHSYPPSPMLNNNSTYWISDTGTKCSPDVWHRNKCWQLWCEAPPLNDWGEWGVSHPRYQALKNPMGKQAPSAPPESKSQIAPPSLLGPGVLRWLNTLWDCQEVKPGFRAILVYRCVKCFSFHLSFFKRVLDITCKFQWQQFYLTWTLDTANG